MLLDDTDRLLLKCIQRDPGLNLINSFHGMNVEQWGILLARSRVLGVEPIFTASLYKMNDISMPDEIKSQVRKDHMSNVARNMRITQTLKEITSLFAEHRIETILLKGAHLSYFIYENIGQRTMSDIDLMVKESDLAKAERKLVEIGFETQRKFGIETESAIHHHLPPLMKEGGNVPVELHWTLVYPNAPFTIDLKSIWEQSEEHSIGGSIVRVLSAPDLVLMLAIHCAYHDRFDYGLKTLCDVDAIIKFCGTKLIWEDLIARARSWKADRCLFIVLSLAKKHLDVIVPEAVLDKLEPENISVEYYNTAEERIFAKEPNYLYLPPQLARLWSGDSYNKRAKLFWRQAFPSPGSSEPFYRRLFVYYPHRTRDLISRYGDTAWKLIKGDREKHKLVEWENRGNLLVDWLGKSDGSRRKKLKTEC
jgi:hypothetical protein